MLLNRKKVRFYARIVALVTVVLMVGFYTLSLIPSVSGPVNNPSTTAGQATSNQNQTEADKKSAEAAIPNLEAELKKAPNDKQLMLALANTYSDAAKYKEAIEAYKSYLKVDPNNVGAQIDLGTSYFNSGDIDNAIKEFEKGLKIDNTYPTGWYNLGVAYMQKGSNTEAIKAWEKFIKLNPNDDRVKDLQAEIDSLKKQEKSDAK